MTPAALRRAFRVAGLVPIAAGLDTVVRGPRSLPGQPRATASVDSELRFYAAFYVAYGLAVVRTASRADHDGAAVRRLAAALFGAGVARAVAWGRAGAPHRGQRALLAAELVLPPVAVAAQARVDRDRRGSTAAPD